MTAVGLRLVLLLSWSCLCLDSVSPDPCHGNTASSFIWRIKSQTGFKDSYLFGTVHVPYTRVWDSISQDVKNAFVNSDQIMFELDLLNPITISSLAECQLLPNGLKLHEVIPQDLYKRLKRHLNYIHYKLPTWMSKSSSNSGSRNSNFGPRTSGLYSEYLFNAMTNNWERKRPIWIVLMINSLTESDIKSRGIPTLDVYLAQEATRLNKQIGSVEKAKDNCLSLNSLSNNHAIYALNDTLSQHEFVRRLKNQKRRKNKKRRRNQDHQSEIEIWNQDHVNVNQDKQDDPASIKNMLSIMPTDDLARHYNCGNLTFFTKHQGDQITALLDVQNPANSAPSGNDTAISDVSTYTNNNVTLKSENVALKIDNYIRSELIIGRNRKWTRKIIRLLKNNPNESFFFAFGAGHFLGKNSVIDMLRQSGFEISRIGEEQKESNS